MTSSPRQPAYLRRYSRMATRASGQVIAEYSTSFSLATRLLAQPVRSHICNLYAMVRIADEIVDGTATAAGVPADQVAKLLDEYESAVLAAPGRDFHTDPVLHAWAHTARQANIPHRYVTDFFAAMRRDLHQNTYTAATDLDEYVHGSAEVIGLMCLRIFLIDGNRIDDLAATEAAASRFGAALQKVNFLRDLREDSEKLGRQYFPCKEAGVLTDAEKSEIIAEIRADLSVAKQAIPALPGAARTGVLMAWLLFNDLADRLDAATVAQIRTQRIRVPAHVKARFGVQALAEAARMGLR
nr:phytoene/squalene synthase family protein [Corynebacterium ulceribovis]